MKNIFRGIFFLLILYAISCVVIYSFPQYFYYNPTTTPSNINKARSNGYDVTEVKYKATDGTELIGWYSNSSPRKQVVLFLHGNSYNLEALYLKVAPLAKAGYDTFMAEYRGFGGIPGKITQKNLVMDAHAAVEYLHSLGYKNEDIILYGFSLGTHIATKVAFDLQKNGKFKAIILEAPFDSLLGPIKNKVPIVPSFVVKDKYDTLSLINYVDSRILIMTGSEDTLVPSKLSLMVYHYAEYPKTIKIYHGGKHNNLLDHGNDEHIIEWLEYGEIKE